MIADAAGAAPGRLRQRRLAPWLRALQVALSVALPVALLGSLPGCRNEPPVAAPPAAPRRVALVEVATQPLPRMLAVTGVLAAQDELTLGLQVGGSLAELAIDVGARVQPGQLLAAMDPRDFALEVARAQAALDIAVARLGLGHVDSASVIDAERTAAVREAAAVLQEAVLVRARVASLVVEQLLPEADLEAADAALAVASSRLQRARDDFVTALAEWSQRRVELAQAEKRQADSRLLAPWPGVVAARYAAAGQVLAAGERLLLLLRDDPLRLRLSVPERVAGEVAVGQRVLFSVDGTPDTGPPQPREGRIVRLGAALDRSNRTRSVEAQVDNARGELLVGAFCRARIVVAEQEQVLVVPRSAVTSFAGVDRVFRVAAAEDGAMRAKGQVVQLGRVQDAWVEVRAGLVAGERIVHDAAGLLPETPVAVEH